MLTGDFAKVARWASSVASLDSGSSRLRISGEMANETVRLIQEEFATERDPFGNPWAPKRRPDGRPIGTGKTGKLKKYRVKNASASGFTVHSPDARYRKYFHGGTRRRSGAVRQVPRRISPGGVVPNRWNAAYQRVWQAHCHLKLRG